uniref:CSON009461 protein n=1 Tax=Culicoides sonorensis TaxID=179676 RepID=A0A336M2S7_CULSO
MKFEELQVATRCLPTTPNNSLLSPSPHYFTQKQQQYDNTTLFLATNHSNYNTNISNNRKERKTNYSWPVIYESDGINERSNWLKSPQNEFETAAFLPQHHQQSEDQQQFSTGRQKFFLGADGIDFYYGSGAGGVDPNAIDDNHNTISNDSSMNDCNSRDTQNNNNNFQTQLAPNLCTSTPNPVAILFLTLLMTTEHYHTEHRHHIKDRGDRGHEKPDHKDRGGVFLVPMHGGVWTMCIDLTQDEIRQISERGIPGPNTCVKYLADAENLEEEVEIKDWRQIETQPALHPQIRMQNLSISCALVCLIILASAALVGAFGVCQRQLSAILVTGVMYFLAALFAVFTLTIIHFKRYKSHTVVETDYDIPIDGIVAARGTAKIAQSLLAARIFTTDWCLDLSWGGVVLCTLTSFLWIFLSKILRWNPLSAML